MSNDTAPGATLAPVIIHLTQPVQAHGETITELRLRVPTGDDIHATGFPVMFRGDGATAVNVPAASALIARLAGVPLSTIRALAMPDITQAVAAVVSFMSGPDAGDAASDEG